MTTIVTTLTTTGTTNWVCPPGVTSVQVQLWGAGGTGGPATGTASGAGGGAGGQYAIKQVTVVPGTSYAVVVPAASTAATSVVNGADATFATTTVVAKGGAGGAAATGATSVGGAGSTTSGVGDTVFAGGSGGTGVSSTVSAGGGSGAGTTGTGNSGSGQTAGVAKTVNGGAGGTGVSVANTRNAGSNYGGGGSGGLSSSATDRSGGNGAQGLAVLTYTLNPPYSDDFNRANSATSAGTLWVNQRNVMGINTNAAYPVTANLFNLATCAGEMAGEDHYSEIVVGSQQGTSTDFLWVVMGSNAVGEGVRLELYNLSSTAEIWSYTTWDSGFVQRAIVSGVNYTTADIFRLGRVGNVYTALKNGAAIGTGLSWTDSGDIVPRDASHRIVGIGGYNQSTTDYRRINSWAADAVTPSSTASYPPPVRRPNYGGLLQL